MWHFHGASMTNTITSPAELTSLFRSIVYRNPVYHQCVFASLVLLTAFRTNYLLRAKASKLTESLRRSILKLFWTGTGLFAFGFFVWNLDNVFCETLTSWKRFIGW